MLQHPWLNMTPNYEYKYSDREYEVMLLKKQLKDQVKGGGQPVRGQDDQAQEMNELIESDEEINGADIDENRPYVPEGEALDSSAEEDDEDENEDGDGGAYDEDEVSLVDSDEEREIVKKSKAKGAKINNSFTGPYPLDPTDFNHTDKGANNQFTHLL